MNQPHIQIYMTILQLSRFTFALILFSLPGELSA